MTIEQASFTTLVSLQTAEPSPPTTTPSFAPSTTAHLFARATATFRPGSGTTPPTSVPNTAVFVLFGLIGAGLVVTAIWFFFSAKNGGFIFREGDWEDYKTTVLRRRGPNGTTLSGGTRTTDLGGGSVVGKRARMNRYADMDIESSIGSASEMGTFIAGDTKERMGRAAKGTGGRRGGTRGSTTHDPNDAVRAYRHEKPARVGGLNCPSDARTFDASSDGGSGGGIRSVAPDLDPNTPNFNDPLLRNRETTPTTTPTKVGRGRGAVLGVGASSPAANAVGERERERRVRVEARKLQESGRAAAAAAAGTGGRRARDTGWGGRDGSGERKGARVPGGWA